MARETLTCQEKISADTISALRDETLDAGEAARLRAHIGACAACQARLADFDRMASALRGQRELDPGDRILEGVQARIAEGARRPLGGRIVWNSRNMRAGSGGRRLWTGLAALAPVAAIILLFVYVFAGIGKHPISSSTPTVSIPTPTPTFFKQIQPTATPALVHVPTFTPSVPAAQAWRSFKPAIDVTFKPSGTSEFIPNVFSSDLTTIGGVFLTFGPGANQTHMRLAYYTIATGAVTKLSPTWGGYDGLWGGMRAIDSRFIVYGFNSQPGATCGICHNTLWSLDRATGKTWQLNANIAGDLLDEISADHVVFVSADGQVWVADLAAHTVKVALPIGSQHTADERLLGFQWPYLLYAETPAATPPAQPATTLNILDLATGVNTPITAPMYDQSGKLVDPGGVTAMALVGRTLYIIVSSDLNGVDAQGNPVELSYGALYRLDDFTSAGKFTAIAYWQEGGPSASESQAWATRHLIWLGSGYFWDNAELRLVSSPLDRDSDFLLGSVQLISSDITAVDQVQVYTPFQTYHARAYDTSSFPTPPGF